MHIQHIIKNNRTPIMISVVDPFDFIDNLFKVFQSCVDSPGSSAYFDYTYNHPVKLMKLYNITKHNRLV